MARACQNTCYEALDGANCVLHDLVRVMPLQGHSDALQKRHFGLFLMPLTLAVSVIQCPMLYMCCLSPCAQPFSPVVMTSSRCE